MRAWTLFLLAAGALALAACGEDAPGVAPRDLSEEAGQQGDDATDEADQSEDAAPDAQEGPADLEEPPDLPGEEEADPRAQESCPEGWEEGHEEPREIALNQPLAGSLPGCQRPERFLVAASQMDLTLSLTDLPPGSVVEVASMRGEILVSGLASQERAAELSFTTPESGEWRVRVRRLTGLEEGSWEGALTCQGGCDRETTRYPIVLLHGMAGTDTYFGVLEYWYRIPDFLRERGYRVYVTVSQFIGHSERRAPVIAEQLDEILEETGAGRLHLIGHSQGGLDMRVLVSGMGYDAHAASMTSIGTPHEGLKVEVPAFLTGMDFGETYLQGEFREQYPDKEALPRFSWAGQTCRLLDLSCQEETGGEIVTPIFSLTYRTMLLAHGDDEFGGANDGLIPVASARWGEFLGILPADHIDQVGQIADQREGPFDHLGFFLSEAQRLRQVELDHPELTPGR